MPMDESLFKVVGQGSGANGSSLPEESCQGLCRWTNRFMEKEKFEVICLNYHFNNLLLIEIILSEKDV